ncbi:hypothetical protein DFH09DRAFT_1087519 [Mycena vulgaris]|nr:hypothetical protein DFH09DRAFT_1087519 [Mycena vulgaris]
MDAFMGEAQGWHSISFHALARLARSSHIYGVIMVQPLLIPCFTPSSVSLSRDSDIAEMRERTWLGAGVMPSAQRGAEWRPAQLARRPDDQDDDMDVARKAHTDSQRTPHSKSSCSVLGSLFQAAGGLCIAQAQRGAEWRPTQLAHHLNNRDDDTDNVRGRPAPTACFASSFLLVFDSTGIWVLHTLRHLRCEHGARVFPDMLPGIIHRKPQCITHVSPPLATSLHRVVSVAMHNQRYFFVH